MGFFSLHARYLGIEWSGWIGLIKNEILITVGMVWPVCSGKWEAPSATLDLRGI